MKRFTETNKWDDPWFHALSPGAKLLWGWLTDKCDAAGVIDVALHIAAFQIGTHVDEGTLEELSSRMVKLECGKYLIPSFVGFQVGTPSLDCKAHRPIFQSRQKHKIDTLSNGYPDGSQTVQDKEKEKDKDSISGKEGVGGKPISAPTEAQVMAYAEGATIPIPRDCALRWLTDRETSDWMRPKGLHMLPVLPNWQADLRGYAQDWNKREDERKARAGPRTPTGQQSKGDVSDWHAEKAKWEKPRS